MPERKDRPRQRDPDMPHPPRVLYEVAIFEVPSCVVAYVHGEQNLRALPSPLAAGVTAACPVRHDVRALEANTAAIFMQQFESNLVVLSTRTAAVLTVLSRARIHLVFVV